jgi:hypothetical protein
VAALLLLSAAAPCARAADVFLSSKYKPTSLNIRDNQYVPRGKITLWKFRLHPFLRQELEYDSNIYLEEDDAQDDVLWFTSAGVRADLLPDTHELNLGYKLRVFEFVQSGKLDRIEHVADVRGLLAFSNLRVEVTNIFEKLHNPLNFLYTRAIRRYVDTLRLSALGSLGRFRLGADYQFQWYDFRGAFDDLDHMSHTVSGRVKVEVSPRVELLADYSFARVDYSKDVFAMGPYDDFDLHSVYAGLGGLLSSKVRALLKGGYIYQVMRGSATRDPGFQGVSGLLTVTWVPTENLRIDASYMRQLEISQFRSYQVVDRLELKFEQHFGPKVTAQVYGCGELTDPADRPGGVADENEWFLRLSFGLRLEYNVQEWLATGAWFEYARRITDITGNEYTDIRAGAHVTVYF